LNDDFVDKVKQSALHDFSASRNKPSDYKQLLYTLGVPMHDHL
jgi:hypothetical protein